ncbi:MAG: hypothetical protein RJB38_2041 [Pseudomonadota bacterium]|jgi:hypothetical protein
MNKNDSKSALASCLRSPFLERLGAAALLAAVLTGCGKESFETINSVKQSEAPGFFNIAPKVDIILAQDNTGSMKDIYSSIGSEIPKFLSQLEKSGWDYHFAAIPLTGNNTQALFSEIVASRQDRNWGQADWIAPYPGAQFNDPEPSTITSSFFRRPADYSDYRYKLLPNGTATGTEAGLQTITTQLATKMGGTRFHRSDAMLVVIVLGNGDDTSGRMICKRSDNYQAPCDFPSMEQATIISCGTPSILSNGCVVNRKMNQYASSYGRDSATALRAHFKSALEALRPNPAQVKLYAAVATGSTCYGAGSYSGYQYAQLAKEMGGTAQNFCVSQTSSMLNSIRTSLEQTRMTLYTVHLMLDFEPNESTIEVVRYINGDTKNAVTIPKSTTNGWSYAGRIIDQPRVVAANGATMNLATGWAVKLNGSARLSGNDTAKVIYKPRTP